MWSAVSLINLALFKIASASGVGGGGTGGGVDSGAGTSFQVPNPIGATTVQGVIDIVFPKLVLLAAPIVAIMVLWGGFQILSSRGDPEKFKSGRNTILYAALGYGIILLAGGVTYVVQSLLDIK